MAGSVDTTQRFSNANVVIEISLTLLGSGPRGLLPGDLPAQIVAEAKTPAHPAPAAFLQPLGLLAHCRRSPIPAGERGDVLGSHVTSVLHEGHARDRARERP